MRISFIVSSLYLSGGVRVIVEYANRLARRGHMISIVTPRDTVDEIVAGELDPQVTVLETARSWSDIRYDLGKVLLAWQLARAVPDGDVVVATQAPTVVAALIAARILRRGCPFWLYQDSFKMYEDRPVEQWLLINTPRFFDKVLVVSQACQDEIREHSGSDSIVVGEGISHADLFRPRSAARSDEGTRQILFLGDMRPRKGWYDFLAAAHRVYEEIPNLRLLIVSKDECQIESDVPFTFFYRPPRDKLAELYATCNVFVSASWSEAFGLPPLEAMACGAPVILTDSRGVREFAVDGENCLMVPIQDPDSLADAILRVLTDEKLAKRIASNGLQTASRYSWDDAVDKFEQALSDM